MTSPITGTTGRGRGYTHPSNAGVDGCPRHRRSWPPPLPSPSAEVAPCRPRDTCSSPGADDPISSSVDHRYRDLGLFGVCLVVGGLALGSVPRIPGLALVDVGFAALGRLAGEGVRAAIGNPLPPAVAGLLVPVAIPLVLAVRFLGRTRERYAGALCLAWAATVLTALAVTVREAAEPGPAGSGTASDWAVVLGPPGLRLLDRAGDVAGLLRFGAGVLVAAAAVICIAPLVVDVVRAAGRPEQPAAVWNGPNGRRV